jgi:hypothetical protein
VEVDFGCAWDFIDDAGRTRQLVFRRNWAPPGDPTFSMAPASP